MSFTKQVVQRWVEVYPVVIFTRSWCPYCTKAKERLKNIGLYFHEFELDTRPDGEQIHDVLVEMTRMNTVPNIFIKKEHIGGWDELLKLNDQIILAKYKR